MFIVKVPGINSSNNTTSECRNAGNAIISELRNIRTNEKGNSIQQSSLGFEEIHVDNENLQEQHSLISKNSLKTFQTRNKTAFLGGDHSISYSLIKSFLNYTTQTKEQPCLIIFDAHPDCKTEKKESFPTNESFLNALITEGFPVENILLVGARSSSPEEISFLKDNKIRQISINQINENLEETTDIIMEFTQQRKTYISIDIDIIDPAFAPATYHKEPGGLTSRQAIYICSRLNLLKNLKAIDLVEVNSEEDKKHNNITTKLAAKILAEFL